jgi:hypothetical protein
MTLTTARALRVVIWVPGAPVNPKNVSGLGLWKHRRLIRDARLRAQEAMLKVSMCWPMRQWPWPADAPKHITFTAHLARLLDDDSLPFALSPIRDALGDMGLIGKTPGTWRGAGRVKDAPQDGHRFAYAQVVDRDHVGVEIIVERAPCPQQ